MIFFVCLPITGIRLTISNNSIKKIDTHCNDIIICMEFTELCRVVIVKYDVPFLGSDRQDRFLFCPCDASRRFPQASVDS